MITLFILLYTRLDCMSMTGQFKAGRVENRPIQQAQAHRRMTLSPKMLQFTPNLKKFLTTQIGKNLSSRPNLFRCHVGCKTPLIANKINNKHQRERLPEIFCRKYRTNTDLGRQLQIPLNAENDTRTPPQVRKNPIKYNQPESKAQQEDRQQIQKIRTAPKAALLRPPSLLNNQYSLISRNQIIYPQQKESPHQARKQMCVFLGRKNCFARLIKSESYEQYASEEHCHEGLLKVYGRTPIGLKSYLLTETFDGLTLASVLEQFGPCNQRLIRKYVKQLLVALSTYHSKGHAFNLLNTETVFVNPEGNIAIDTAKSRSTGRIKSKQKLSNFYYLSPQLMFFQSNGCENDTWSLGALILSMITGQKIDQQFEMHPFNCLSTKSQSSFFGTENQRPEKLQYLVDEIRKAKKQYHNAKQSQAFVWGPEHKINKFLKIPSRNQKIVTLQISSQLQAFIKECFKIEGRSSARNLLKSNSFFQI